MLSTYQKAGSNHGKKNGIRLTRYNLAITPATGTTVIYSPGNGKIIDYIDIYCSAGAIQLTQEYPAGTTKSILKAGAPGKILYPGRYCESVNLSTISVLGVTVGGVGAVGDLVIAEQGVLDQSATIP
jgi:hypothetical protein